MKVLITVAIAIILYVIAVLWVIEGVKIGPSHKVGILLIGGFIIVPITGWALDHYSKKD